MDRTTQKHIFGFDKGYIWVVKHSISKLEDEILNKSNARYSKKFGWYFFDKPDELPEKYKIYKLKYDGVCEVTDANMIRILVPMLYQKASQAITE